MQENLVGFYNRINISSCNDRKWFPLKNHLNPVYPDWKFNILQNPEVCIFSVHGSASDEINSYQIPVEANHIITATHSHSSGNWGCIDFANYSSSIFFHIRDQRKQLVAAVNHTSVVWEEKEGGFSFFTLIVFLTSSLSLLLIFYSLHSPHRLTRLLIKPPPPTSLLSTVTGIKPTPPYCLPYFTLFPLLSFHHYQVFFCS